MVAEALEAPAKASIKPNQGKHPRLRAKIPLATRVKARNLYVLQQLGAPEVGKAVGLTAEQIYSLAAREGWTKVRKQIKSDTLESADARIAEQTDELVEAVAMESAELTLSTFKAAKEVLAAGGEDAARNVQAYSQATKNYVGLYRQAKSLDVGRENTLGVNVLFISCARVGIDDAASKSEPKRVEPSAAPVDAKVTQVASEA